MFILTALVDVKLIAAMLHILFKLGYSDFQKAITQHRKPNKLESALRSKCDTGC